MTKNSVPASQTLKQAHAALMRGNKQEARHWAQIAAAMAPELEEPWLILAAVARPRASIAYLRRALAINPQSERARKGLEWVHRQINTQVQPLRQKWGISGTQPETPVVSSSAATIGNSSFQVSSRAKSAVRFSHPILILLLVLCVFAAWVFWPGMNSSASQVIRAIPNTVQSKPVQSWMEVNLGMATHTPLPTATQTPTQTPSHTPSPTAIATSTATIIPSSTPLILPLPTNTPLPPVSLLDGEFVIDQVPVGGEKLIVVSIHEQHMYVYQGDTLVFSFVASTGMEGSATKPGTYSILDKIPNAYGSTWDIWMPNWMGIYRSTSLENGIHALPIMQNGQRLWAGVLGAPISYGCVVLGVEESQLLYDWAEVGVTVRIDP
jgi:lipoprotein-anchoring transpeptidase ErfK/SrfK